MRQQKAIKIKVIKLGTGPRRGAFVARWREGGKPRERTLAARRRSAALREASSLEAEVNQVSGPRVTWGRFDAFYRAHHLNTTSKANQKKWNAVGNYVSAVFGDTDALYLDTVNAEWLARLETYLRENLAAGSIDSYVATLRAGLALAESLEYIAPLPRRARRGRQVRINAVMRVRAITPDDMRKILAATPGIVGEDRAGPWKRYIQVLWLSGCRLTEPLDMDWGRLDKHRPGNLDGPRPTFYWLASQKNRSDQVARITLKFAAWLKKRAKSRGRIVPVKDSLGKYASPQVVQRTLSAICKDSGVMVAEDTPVTAKHFRSSFGTRQAGRGVPLVMLQNMLRHSSVTTTRNYYVGGLEDAQWAEADLQDVPS